MLRPKVRLIRAEQWKGFPNLFQSFRKKTLARASFRLPKAFAFPSAVAAHV